MIHLQAGNSWDNSTFPAIFFLFAPKSRLKGDPPPEKNKSQTKEGEKVEFY